MAEQQRWAEMAVEARGDLQEVVGALMVEVAGTQGYATTPTAVTGYLPVDERLENTLLKLKEALRSLPEDAGVRGVPTDVTVRFVAEEDWASAWKQYFKPQRIGERIVVKPTWEAFSPAPEDVVVEIDPGMAFGTGLHPTTRLCLRALEAHVRPGMTAADVGTGSGILAVAAARLGASRVAAVDIDPLAVRIARENIAVNQVTDVVVAEESPVPPAGSFDIVVANILADIILNMAPALFAATAPGGGLLLASGIIDTRAQDVLSGLTQVGYTDVVITRESEWVCLIARRP
jgi:ribosomal protein L11 methyltransferase